MTKALTKVFPEWRRLLVGVWTENHILVLAMAVAGVGFSVYAWIFHDGAMAAIVLLVFLLVIPLLLLMFFLIAMVLEGSPHWPRASAFVRRTFVTGVFGYLAYIGGKSTLAESSFDRPKVILAWLLVAALAWCALMAALGRKPTGRPFR